MADQLSTPISVPPGDNLDETAVQELTASFRGQLVRSQDDGYDAARSVFNAMIDRRPALIARCTGVADVMAAVRFAQDNDLRLAIWGGGHSVPGYGV